MMFDKKIYMQRRSKLIHSVSSGLILLPGNDEMPINYKANTFRFRQDSSFLYFAGLDLPGLFVLIDRDQSKTILFGNDPELDEIIWMGPRVPLADQAAAVGIGEVQTVDKLEAIISRAMKAGRPLHYLPVYHESLITKFSQLSGQSRASVITGSSEELSRAVIEQRSVKDSAEIRELEEAVAIAWEMHTTAMRMAKEGLYEKDIAGTIEGIALAKGNGVSFPVILSVHGEILHNHYHGNQLKNGDMVINDSGAESGGHYASDVTRTFPVSGRFSQRQKEIYQIVLQAQIAAIEAVRPGKLNKEIHLQCASMLVSGLKEIGLMRGDTEEAVRSGAHALFFPHGLGHMLGLDVHDMEGLGENLVGYDKNIRRSDQFGLAYLRMAKTLQPGYVLTIEPGLYFIPSLIEKWRSEKKLNEFINYERVNDYIDFGGIRIEDDVLVTAGGRQVIGKPIPKTVAEVESTCQTK